MSKEPLPTTLDFPEMEKQVLIYWKDTKAFERQVEMRPENKPYVFYDGPPFATGMPHYGHLLGSTAKDVIPRYWAMKGYRVERVWGWDCHGLPIENMIEQQLQIKGGKKGIEEMGIARFNAACRAEVLRLDQEWETIIDRLGRWVDFANNYKTMDTSFMESVWWGFSQLHENGLIYEGRKVVMYCPRCATPLSNFEIAMDNSYEMVEDHSIFVKFPVDGKADEYLLAWTTTPWTLPGNVGLAVDPQADYVKVRAGDEHLWLAEALLEKVMGDREYQAVETVKGEALVGTRYTPLYPYMEEHRTENAWMVMPGDFVSMEDGTGVVHTAALFGEDDYDLALEYKLPLVPTLDDGGKFLPFVEVAAGLFYKKAEDTINTDLQARGLVFKLEKIYHSYPFCYRCSTPLYYNAVPAWFINVQKLKPDLIAQNENINWYPEHLKYGRFGKGLESAPDWNISRSRYWGTPMPVWRHDESGRYRVIGSRDELRQWAVNPGDVGKLEDIHREFIDDIEVWVDDERTMKGRRIPEVFDCWVESGSMPFAQHHYPFENKEKFERSYPAQFVSEYIAQTRAWFYTMHVMSVGIFGSNAVENTLTTGTIMAEDGSKMSKSKKNFPDPVALMDKYGVDSLRLYMMSSPVMKSENINFNEAEVGEIRKRVFNIWYNMYAFYRMYAGERAVLVGEVPQPHDVMDRWVMSRVQSLIQSVTEAMDGYNVVKASRALMAAVDEVSTWYLRRSRDRLRGVNSGESQGEARGDDAAVAVFGYVLVTLAQLFAPFAPFFTEWLFQHLVDPSKSVHHTDWPVAHPELIDTDLETQMETIRRTVERTHAARKEAGIKVRQPLARVSVFTNASKPAEELLAVLLDEVNVKEAVWQDKQVSAESDSQSETDSAFLDVQLDTNITPELQAEGEARELIREIQKLRKKAGLTINDRVVVQAPAWPQSWQTEIENRTNSSLVRGEQLNLEKA